MTNETSRQGKPWTPEDIEMLRQLAADGQKMKVAMAELQRSGDAIRQKGLELGIALGRRKP